LEVYQVAHIKTLFVPETGRNRLTSMVANRPDWCISRQRDWGVPIAFFRVKETGAVIFDEKVLNYVAMIFEMQGSDAWYSMSIEELLYPGSGYKAEELDYKSYVPEASMAGAQLKVTNVNIENVNGLTGADLAKSLQEELNTKIILN